MRTRDLEQTARAQTLRKGMTDSERNLWYKLRGRRFSGHKFTRQFPIGPYFVDFCCRKEKLVIEADGSQHSESAYDDRRDQFILNLGYRILRFWNQDILNDIDTVGETIAAALDGTLEAYERYKLRA